MAKSGFWAFRYFNLLKGFGSVPVIGDVVSSLTDDYTPLFVKKSIPEVIAYITSELDAAIAELPQSSSSDWKRGRATKGAAMGLKSRLLLYAASPLYTGDANDLQKWQNAANAAKAVMDLGIYDLVSNLDPNPAENYYQLSITPNTKEDIFSREYITNVTSMGLEHMNAPNGYDGWGGNCPMQNLVDDYEMSNGLPITDAASGYDAQNPYVNRDPRFYGTVLYNGRVFRGRAIETFMPGGKDSPDGSGAWNTSPTGYSMRKFCNESVDINDWSNMGKAPWRYIRYAEILLNYAEAQNEAVGPDVSVYTAINKIRTRAGMPNLPAGLSQDAMRTRIRNERRIELAYEEHRYFDVRRWKIAMVTENMPARGILITKAGNGALTYTSKIALAGKAFQVQHYWYPIPLEEINASNGKLAQNPGY
jgi:starch-binding outer membrane protein, SusD/RagB family